MAKITISIDDGVKDALNDHLEYGDNRSEWIQEAIEKRLKQEADTGNPNSPPLTATSD